MKITTRTPDLLVIDDRPVLLGLMLILFIMIFAGVGIALVLDGTWAGLIFVVFGGGMGVMAFAVFVRRSQVVFHRPERWVEIRRRSMFGSTTVRHDLTEIARAETEVSLSTKNGPTRRVALVIEGGQSAGNHPVTEVYSSGPGAQRARDAINDWLGISADEAERTG